MALTTSKLPIVFVEGTYRIQFGNGLSNPLTNHGEPVESFDPGWFPRFAYIGFYPLIVLELQNADGRQATWWLDQAMNGIGDRIAHLDARAIETLRVKSAPIMRHVIDSALSTCGTPSETVASFYELNDATRQEIIEHFLHLSLHPIAVRNLSEENDIVFTTSRNGETEAIDRLRLMSALAIDFSSGVSDWLEGSKSWPSIYGNSEMQFRGSMPLNDFTFALKFSQDTSERSVFLLVSHHYFQVIGVFIPSSSEVFCKDNAAVWLFRSLYVDFEGMLSAHIKKYHPLLERYFGSQQKRIASLPRLVPQTHLGHQLWNELSGVDRVVKDCHASDWPEWWIVEKEEPVEIYGPLEKLYPEVSACVRRSFETLAEATSFAYQNNFALLRITDEYVSDSLRRRIKRLVDENAIGEDVNGFVAANRIGPIVMFGLRTENRTHIDPVDFFVRMAKSFERKFGQGIIVIDGHNGPEDVAATGMVRSHGEHLSTRPPIEVEQDIVDAVRLSMEGTGVIVVSTIGKSVYRSAAWGNNADCFIGIWGAGLAKYRWLSNLPGAIISSWHNLQGRPDFDIYYNEKYMENPSEILIPSPDIVEDDADAPLLIKVSDQATASYYNFRDRKDLFESFLQTVWLKIPQWRKA